MKNGKLKRAIIVACIPFIFATAFAFADMYFSVKNMKKAQDEANDRHVTGQDTYNFVDSYYKYNRGVEENINPYDIEMYNSRQQSYYNKWFPSRSTSSSPDN